MEAEGVFFNSNDYKIQSKKLGEGSYGTVYVAENTTSKQKYAAKIINVENGFDGYEQMLFLRESLILHKLDHPSIVKFMGINFQSFRDPKLLEPTIITEYLPHGSLRDNLNKEKNSLSDLEWTVTKKYINLLGISDALRYLHENGIVHRDLKPENILIDSDYYPRVCDFGLSKCFPNTLTNSTKLTVTGQFGTLLYLPPEILDGGDSYNQSVDVYAFAMIAYEIVTGKRPFSELGQNISPFTLTTKIVNGYRPSFDGAVTEKMKQLISKCWSQNPKERPTFHEIFEKLSSDMTYFNETIEEAEVQDYLDMLLDSTKERAKNQKSNNKDENYQHLSDESIILKNEIKELKEKLEKIENDSKAQSASNDMLHTGFMFLFNSDNERDKKEKLFVKYLEMSSEKGNGLASLLLGYLHYNGNMVEKNRKLAAKYYLLSAKQGNQRGCDHAGNLYYFGDDGVTNDKKRAIQYFQKGAELGDSVSMVFLSELYIKGEYVDKNESKSFELLEKAAELNNPVAFSYLAGMYAEGYVVKQDYSKAISYYEKMAELGEDSANQAIKMIKIKMMNK